MDAVGVDHELRDRRPGLPAQLDAKLLGSRLHQLDHVGDRLVQVRRLEGRLAVLREREHVHDQVIDLALVLLDDGPAAADDRLVLFLQAHVDQIAAAADALEDVLDVVRKRGDGLPDGREPLGLELGLVKGRVFDREAGLVTDRDHQLQVLLGEPPA